MTSMKNDTRPKPQPLGIIFALPIEAHTFERRLGNATKYQGQKSVIYEGHVFDHPVVWTISGVGQEAARNAAQLIIDGHQPHTLISAGFAGALAPHLE
ncbi:MAG TPA: nucleoside phosphorylase, partial [Planctomycetaceae bacterium]|nr:nucleoside phosphorylase [Planctomycetaceae bacterium]